MNILFICTENENRSQMAEAFMKKMADEKGLDLEIVSAGTELSGEQCTLAELLPKTKEVIESMEEKGLDVSQFERKPLTDDMLENAHYIVSMAEEETEPEDLSMHPAYRRWEVLDPKGMDRQGTDEVRDEIEENVEAFAEEILESITG